MSKRHTSTSGPSQRQLRAGELIRHALVDLLQHEEFRDPVLRDISITVSEVRASPDLKQATVYCTPLGGVATPEIITALNKVGPHLRGLLGRKIEMKFTPELRFRQDETFAEAERIDQLLATPKVAKDLKNP